MRAQKGLGEEKDEPRRSLFARLRRRVLQAGAVLLVLVIVLAVAGAVWEQSAAQSFAQDFPPAGELVTLADGRRMHFVSRGEGEPTVVLESGLGDSGRSWDVIADEIATTTRVISYDRAGYGWSDPSDAPSDARSITEDLHEGLAALG